MYAYVCLCACVYDISVYFPIETAYTFGFVPRMDSTITHAAFNPKKQLNIILHQLKSKKLYVYIKVYAGVERGTHMVYLYDTTRNDCAILL